MISWMGIRSVAAFLVLIPCAITDIRTRKIPVAYCVCLAILGAAVRFWVLKASPWETLLGGALGASLLIISCFSHGAIGFGDGILLTAIGLWCGIGLAASAAVLAFFTTFLFGMILILMKKIDRKGRLPFAPFLCFSFLVIGGLDLLRAI